MQKLLFVFAVLAVFCQCEAKSFDRCSLVRELRRLGFPEDKMSDWVCLVENESSMDTSKTHTNTDGSKDYGLFQINDAYWCSSTNTPGKDCNITCDDLLKDDITDAAKCALVIYNRHNFQAWYGWQDHCQSPNSLPDISSC